MQSKKKFHLVSRLNLVFLTYCSHPFTGASVPGANAKKERIASVKDSSQYRGDSNQIPFIVYIGDSSTDLLALLEADVGILIGSSQTVSKFAERWNVALSPLSSKSQEVTSTRQGQSSTVWTVNSWGEIEQFLSQILLNSSS